MLKRFFSIITISLIITGSFFSAYSIEYNVFADSPTDEWTQVTTNEQLVQAFKYYCKSRDVTIEGSVADAVTSFTTKTFNGIVNTLGIDVNTLQANLKYQTDSNLGTRFLFNALSIDAYNRIFSQFLQDNELDVGDSVNNKEIYDGKGYSYNNNFFLVFLVNSINSNADNDSNFIQYGSTYIINSNNIDSYIGTSVNFPIANQSYNISSSLTSGAGWSGKVTNIDGDTVKVVPYYENSDCYGSGEVGIFIDNSNYIWLGDWCHIVNNTDGNERYLSSSLKYLGRTTDSNQSSNISNVNIYINSPTINNNTYEGDTIINNDGTTDTGEDTPSDPDPDPDPPTIPDSGGWQDFSLPDMPNDWLIYGMEKKFPFDIPFNIMFALSLLNHEPEIPKFEGDIDLQVCTWHYDIDLTPFDDIATILRKFEVLAFIIGLAILTKNLINWG